jgi:TATA-binding protein-associated factor
MREHPSLLSGSSLTSFLVEPHSAATLALEALHKQVLPFLLRRLKEDVLHDLPPKIIQDYYCNLSDVQKQLYDDFSHSQAIADVGDVVSTGGGGKGQTHVFQSLQYLRKLCNHPCLVAQEADYSRIAAKVQATGGTAGAKGLRDLENAPKLQALRCVGFLRQPCQTINANHQKRDRQILTDCGIGGGPLAATATSESDDLSAMPQHRVLIFCQLKTMLDVIESDLFRAHMPSLSYMRMDGSTEPSKRHGVVQRFNADPSIDVLLLTTQVGGLGLNLTSADTVIFVEHDWNPQKDLQAMDRAHRLGQKKVVNVYRLITRGTLEEKIMGLQRFKLNIANSVVTQQNAGLESMNTSDVLDLFKISTGEEQAAERKRQAEQANTDGPVSQKSLLEGLEDLPAADEYDGLGMDAFLGSLR